MSAGTRTRGHLEALVLARALASTDPARILARLDRDVVSSAAIAILERMAYPSDESHGPQTKAQQELAERVRAVTVYEMQLLSIDDLLDQVNGLSSIVRARTSVIDVGLKVSA